jgi:hypothetical protein
MNFDLGRRTLFDEYTGGTILLTLRNNTNQCGSIAQNATISLQSHQHYFYVTAIQFDEGITDAEATCTLTGVDAIAQLANYTVSAGTGFNTSPTIQMYDIWNSTGVTPPYVDTPLTSRSSVSGTVASDTTVLNRWSTVINSEFGSIVTSAATMYPIPNGYYTTAQYTFGRSGTTGIPYSDLSRITGTDISANNVIVDYVTSSATYTLPGATWKRTYKRYTVALSGAPNMAQFLARSLTDPTTISGSLTWTDKAATTTNNNAFLNSFNYAPAYVANLEYKLPGGSTISTRIKIEGVSCNATPGQTTWTVNFTDASLYDGFNLDTDSAILGLARFYWT